MCIKVTIVSEEFVTLLVVMGFLTSVDLHVLLKVTRILEGLSTQVTRERHYESIHGSSAPQMFSRFWGIGCRDTALNYCEFSELTNISGSEGH